MKTTPKTKKEVAYVTGLLEYLERTVREVMKQGANEQSDYYMGQINTYGEIIKHIKKTY